jgi:hypothetical protein
MENAAFPTSKIHKSVALGDSDVTERSGKHVPRRGHVEHSAFDLVLGQIGVVGSVESTVQHVVGEAVQHASDASGAPQRARKPMSPDQSMRGLGRE